LLTLPSILFGAFLTLAAAWMLGNICLYRLPVPSVIALAVGAATESSIVFLLLVGGVGNRVSFLLFGAICLGVFLWLRPGAPRLADPVTARADRVSIYLVGSALAIYGTLYAINAMAPELEPDAIAYHLGLASEYVRLGAFPNRVGFYEMLPQGFEMLFVPAFAFGRHSSARLVHCAFLLASVPLIWRIGRRLSLPDGVTLAAAVLYFCAPMVGVAGTSAYTDAGGVFFVLATFYLLLVWRDTRDVRYLAPAGITAGFCYAIKFPGGLVVILALVFVVLAERAAHWRPLALLAGAALAMAAPWALRSFLLTGNPAAPLFNGLFPNPYFLPSMERDLAASLRSFQGLPPVRVFYELVVGGIFQGTLGPVFFALPLGLLALRRRVGRLCWLAAVLLALPWFWNTGARFLMPALPFLALALMIALPRPAVWACIVVQAVACWPQIIGLYHPGYTWRLQRIPWRAALRIQPENDYLAGLIGEYPVARLLQDRTQPGERVFSLAAVATAYTDREVLDFWHSTQAAELTDALYVALGPKNQLFDVRADFTPRPLLGVRIRIPQASPVEWYIHDVLLYSGDYRIFGSPQWQLHGWPNDWELPLAFDGNRATRWRSREPIRAGMFVEADFDRPQVLSSVLMTSPTPHLPFEFYGREGGGWRRLTSRPTVTAKPLGDVRMAATRAVERAGFRYILANDGGGGYGVLGAAMAHHEGEWGLERVGEVGPVVLLRIK
jgi:4-amino-4-deoxy-L-arabinose transferase-like glycosyltransferase